MVRLPYGIAPWEQNSMLTEDWSPEDREAFQEHLESQIKGGGDTKACPPGEARFFQAGTGAWICQKTSAKSPDKKERPKPNPLLVMGIVVSVGVGGWLFWQKVRRS